MEQYLETALFDLDGTLVDTEGQYTRFWAEVGEELIPEGRAFALRVKGRTLKSILEDFIPSPEIRAEVQRQLNIFKRAMEFPLIPGVMEFLSDLRRKGVRLAVVTSSNKEKMRHVEARMPHLLSLFDRILTAEDFCVSKPAPDCYLLGAQVFGTPLERCMVFEDAPNGLQAGMSSGIFTVGLATGLASEVIRPLCHHVERDFLNLDFERANRLLADFHHS
ncbi:MAG: HAD family hydrolase [Bacteroidaceae bacterium]